MRQAGRIKMGVVCGSDRDQRSAARPAAGLGSHPRLLAQLPDTLPACFPADAPAACLRSWPMAASCPCPMAAMQIWVGDFITIDVGDENSKGWSIAQVEELYQDPTASIDVLPAC